MLNDNSLGELRKIESFLKWNGVNDYKVAIPEEALFETSEVLEKDKAYPEISFYSTNLGKVCISGTMCLTSIHIKEKIEVELSDFDMYRDVIIFDDTETLLEFLLEVVGLYRYTEEFNKKIEKYL